MKGSRRDSRLRASLRLGGADTLPIFGPMVTISISPEALAAIAATLPDGREAERRPDGRGGYFITLPHGVVDRLAYLREPGQSYSDVISRRWGRSAEPFVRLICDETLRHGRRRL